MYLTGFADEAGADIDTQIKATKELGWRRIECRNVSGRNLHDIPDDAFDAVCSKLAAAGVQVNCFGSAIANWQKSILDPFEVTLAEVRRAIPRMKRLGTKLIRIMSYPPLKDREPEDQMEKERFRRLREVVRMFNAEGLQPVHENCMNYGGMGYPYALRLLENVPGLRLVFDTGNPVFSADRSKPKPYPMQSSWEFYAQVKAHVVYVHIKDGIWHEAERKTEFTYPGEGHGDVRRVVKDLLDGGYQGGFSIEPHLAAVVHDPTVESAEDVKYRSYVDYGRRMQAMIVEMGYTPDA